MADPVVTNFKNIRKQRAIVALLQYPTLEKAAEAAGVHAATIRRWQRQPQFREALLRARREAFSQSMGRLQHAAQPAVTMLLKIMADPNTAAAVRVRAISTILGQGVKALELEDIDARLTALEQADRTESSL